MADPQPENPKLEITYRRWIIIIPIILMILGMWMFYAFPSINPSIALLGGILAFIGVITFSLLIFLILALELSARALIKKTEPPTSFSEQFEGTTQSNEK